MGGKQVSASAQGASVNYNGADGSFGGGYTYGLRNGFSLGANWNSKESFSATASYSKDGFGISVSQCRNNDCTGLSGSKY